MHPPPYKLPECFLVQLDEQQRIAEGEKRCCWPLATNSSLDDLQHALWRHIMLCRSRNQGKWSPRTGFCEETVCRKDTSSTEGFPSFFPSHHFRLPSLLHQPQLHQKCRLAPLLVSSCHLTTLFAGLTPEAASAERPPSRSRRRTRARSVLPSPRTWFSCSLSTVKDCLPLHRLPEDQRFVQLHQHPRQADRRRGASLASQSSGFSPSAPPRATLN